jgi:two-component system OmpR family response regulator
MKKRVLIIDDDPETSRMLRETLETFGEFLVFEENLGCRALEAVSACSPDIVLLDVMIPDKAGEEIATEIERECGRAKIVFITQLVKPEEAAEGKIGGYPFLSKDSSPSQIRARLESLDPAQGLETEPEAEAA